LTRPTSRAGRSGAWRAWAAVWRMAASAAGSSFFGSPSPLFSAFASPRPWRGPRARRPRPWRGSTACTSSRAAVARLVAAQGVAREQRHGPSSCRHVVTLYYERGGAWRRGRGLTGSGGPQYGGLLLFRIAAIRARASRKGIIAMAEPKVGEKAPDFTLKSTSGDMVSLSQFKGQKNVLVAFFPLAFTGSAPRRTALSATTTRKFESKGHRGAAGQRGLDADPGRVPVQARHEAPPALGLQAGGRFAPTACSTRTSSSPSGPTSWWARTGRCVEARRGGAGAQPRERGAAVPDRVAGPV
jgi:hypothetical protein